MNVIYEVIKSNETAATMLSYDGCLYEILDDLIAMIKSYNMNLARSILSPKLLALRFFEQKDESGFGNLKISPEISYASRKFIEEKISSFNLTPDEDTSDELGIIAITDNDQIWITANERQYVTINLDRNVVSFEGCLDTCSYDDYVINLELGDALSLKNCDFDFENVSFNELEDLRNFIIDNFSGWIDNKNPGKIFIPWDDND